MPSQRITSSWPLIGVLSSGVAVAQPLPEGAAANFNVGISAFEQGNFRRALEAFERVFALRGNPDLLFNIYRCHRAMGDPLRAAQALRRYLIARPGAPDRATLEADLARLDAEARQLAAPVVRAPAPTPRRAASTDPGAGPWIVIGAGVVAAGLGAGLMLAASASQADGSGDSGELARRDRLDSASSQHTAGIALVGVGAAAGLAGVLWRVLAPRAPAVQVAVTGEQVAFTLSARWP